MWPMVLKRLALPAMLIVAGLSGSPAPALAAEPSVLQGQTVYVSVYSNVFAGPKAKPLDLETILSIRNTDMKNSVTVTAIDFYDTHGKLLRRYLDGPITLGALGTKYIHVRERESVGGPGSNFIVKWQSLKPVNEPIIESVMFSTRSGQGISFVIPGKVIRE